MIGPITPANTPKIIPMRGFFSNTSTASMTDQILQEMNSRPGLYDSDFKVIKFLDKTCTDKIENSKTHGTQKTLTAVFNEVEAYLKTKDQMEPAVHKLQEALSLLKFLNPPTAQTSTHIPHHGFQPSSITAAKSKISLSTRIKEGIVSTSDLETLLSDPTVLADPVVQRRVLKGILRGKIVAEGPEGPEGPGARLINSMKTTVTPMLSAEDQADILQVKEGHVHTLGVLLREHPQCIRFFTDPASQRYIAKAIRSGYFGNDPAVLQAVAGQLDIFKDPEAHRDIARAISARVFGSNHKVLKAVAAKLDIFKDPEAQYQIAVAIRARLFGQYSDVLIAVAAKLGIFTYRDAQMYIAGAIRERAFGNDPDVLKVLAEHLHVFTDRHVKSALSAAIGAGCLGVDAGVLKTLYRRNMVSLKSLMTSSPSMQTALYPEFKFSLTLPPEIAETDPLLPSFFGAKLYTSLEVTTALADKFKGISEDARENMCDDNAAYAFQIYDDYVVLCNIGAGSVSEASFKGWITSDYSADTLGKVAVYNCSVLTDGYPSKMEVSETHAEFNALPMYLMEAIRQNSFDSSKFTHPETIDFVASTILGPIIQKNPDLGNKMKGIIQQAILNEGWDVSIASTPAEDGAIKDAINALCTEVAETDNFEVSVMTYFNSLSNDQDKARLAYLLGQIAKAGVLGYHHGEENQANDLFYSLSKKCFDELKSSREMVFPPDFHTHLAAGVCIAVETSRFRSSNSWVQNIFDKN